MTCGYIRLEVERKLPRRIKEQALAGNLQMLGSIDDNKKLELMNSAQLSSYLARTKVLTVIGEAMATDLPVVATTFQHFERYGTVPLISLGPSVISMGSSTMS